MVSKEKRKIVLSGKSSMPDKPETTRVNVVGKILDDDVDRVQKVPESIAKAYS